MLHPAVSLFLWGLLAILAQLLPAVALCAYAAVCAAVALFLARRRLLRLLKRSRYLLLALVVLFAFFTPGEKILPGLDWLPLTREGLVLAGVQVLRVGCVIALVALLLERLPTADLVQGLAVLSAPLRVLGADPERLALRLSLVLEMVAGAQSRHWKDWLQDDAAGTSLPVVQISRTRLGRADGIVAGLLLGMGVVWLICAA